MFSTRANWICGTLKQSCLQGLWVCYCAFPQGKKKMKLHDLSLSLFLSLSLEQRQHGSSPLLSWFRLAIALSFSIVSAFPVLTGAWKIPPSQLSKTESPRPLSVQKQVQLTQRQINKQNAGASAGTLKSGIYRQTVYLSEKYYRNLILYIKINIHPAMFWSK